MINSTGQRAPFAELAQGIQCRLGAQHYHHYQCADCHEICDSWDHPPATNATGREYCPQCADTRRAATTARQPAGAPDVEIPTEYALASWSGVSAKLLPMRDWPKTHPCMLVNATNGVGKTWAKWALIRDLAAKNMLCHEYDCRALRASWWGTMYRRSIEERLINATRLILDDFTAADPAGGWRNLIEMILEQRMTHRRPLLLICHSSPVDIDAKFGAAVLSRLKKFRVISFSGKDRRGGTS